MAEKESEEIKEAKKVYNELSGEAEMKRLAEIRLMSEMEEQAALSSARAKGTEEGMKRIAKKLLKKGTPIKEIIEITDLTEEQLKKLL